MEDKLVTVAIHTYQRAQILKTILESNGIKAIIEDVDPLESIISSGVRIKVKDGDLPAALHIIENTNLSDDTEEPVRTKTVLIPIDFSDYSFQACQLGFNYASKSGAEVIIMHAYFTPYFPAATFIGDSFSYETKENSETINSLIDNAQQKLNAMAAKIKEEITSGNWPNVKYSIVLKDGLPEEEIAAYSKKHKPEMIFMGTRGVDKKDADLIGSVTAEVIETCKSPVFAIPEATPFKNFSEIKRIAFGTSFDQKDLIAADELFRTFKGYDIEYFFFHISEKPDTWHEIKLGGIKEYFQKRYPSVNINYDVVDASDFVLNLEAFIRNNKIDVISLTTHKRNIFARMFNPSMARKMLFHTDTPLLVLR